MSEKEEPQKSEDENLEDEGGEEIVTLPRVKYDEIVEKLADTTQSKANLIKEIKDLREKKQLSESEAEELRKKLEEKSEDDQPTEGLKPEDVEKKVSETVSKILAERDMEAAEENMKSAMRSFQEKYKEFHPDNDEGGLKMSSLEKRLARFNMDGLKSQSDFLGVFEDARKLLVGTKEQPAKPQDPNPIAPAGGGSEPKPAEDVKLSSAELKIVDRSFGGDKERYLKIKAKRPDYVAELLRYAV